MPADVNAGPTSPAIRRKTDFDKPLRYYRREQAAGRFGFTGGRDAVAANITFKESQTRLNEQKLKKDAGELISVYDVRDTWHGIMRTVW